MTLRANMSETTFPRKLVHNGEPKEYRICVIENDRTPPSNIESTVQARREQLLHWALMSCFHIWFNDLADVKLGTRSYYLSIAAPCVPPIVG